MKMNVKKVTYKQARTWIPRSWELFKKTPFLFIGFFGIEIVFSASTHFAPILGGLIGLMVTALVTTSWYLIAQKSDHGDNIDFADFFLGFKKEYFQVVVLLFFLTFLSVIGLVPIFLLAGFGIIKTWIAAKALTLPTITTGLVFGSLVTIVIYSVIAMAAVYAFPLIIFEKIELMQAMNWSLQACWENMAPLTWVSFLLLMLSFATVLTVGVGFFILIPMTKLVLYLSYKDLFEKPNLTPLELTRY